MSLEQLIPTVSYKLNKSEAEIFEILNKITDIVKNEVFLKKRFTSYDMNENIIEPILNELIKLDFASKYFRYECEETDSIDFAVSLNEKCDHCGVVLLNSDDHIINESYRLNTNFLKLMKEQKIINLNIYLDTDYKHNLDKLKGKTNKLIPFLGAGVSVPFGLPNWEDLLLEINKGLNDINQQKYTDLIKEGNYFRALSLLKAYSVTYSNELAIKNDIKSILKSKYIRNPITNVHNINDILKLDSQFILTTNYDNILSEYRSKYRDDYVLPLTLENLEDVTELLDSDSQQVIHFHGNVGIPSSMIVTEEDYETLYNNEGTWNILNAIMANRTLLFIGFSFKDQYFKNLYNKIHNNIKGEHFIIVPNLHPFDARDLLAKNLIPINVKVNLKKENEYSKAINTILNELY